MAEPKARPFAKLDTSLLRSTRDEASQPTNGQQDDKTARQLTSKPVRRHTGRAVSQDAATPVPQETSMPVSQLVKATFYLAPEHVMQLERLRLERLQKGQKVDKSALVREAIERLIGG